MKNKRVYLIAGLEDQQLFDVLSDGQDRILATADRIYEDTTSLKENSRGATILSILPEEEAAKVLILIDAARCPRDTPARLLKHLQKYYNQLAKGNYAAACC